MTRFKMTRFYNPANIKNVEEVRTAVTAFKDRYNRHWRLEKLGFMSPLEARQAYALRKAA